MIVVEPEGGVNLRERQVGMLKMNFFGAPSVSDHVLGYFDDFRVGLVNPGNPALVEPDVCCRYCRHASEKHATSSALASCLSSQSIYR